MASRNYDIAAVIAMGTQVVNRRNFEDTEKARSTTCSRM